MQIELINVTARTISIRVCDGGKYFLEGKRKAEIFLNGEYRETSNKKVVTLQGLASDTDYEVCVKDGYEKSNMLNIRTKKVSHIINIKEFGAVGDGKKDNTLLIQAAINIAPKNSLIEITDGDYMTGPLFLKDDITLELKKGASLIGKEDRESYPVIPSEIYRTDGKKTYLGSWEGEPQECFASLLSVINVKNVDIIGEGTINGNSDYDTWWKRAKEKRTAWRPRTIFILNSENITVEGVEVRNSPSWTVHPIFSRNIRLLNLYIENPKDYPNTDGIDPESCENVEILGVEFSVGDDCIAIKSGKGKTAREIGKPSRNIRIEDCYMKFGHGAVVIGSEMSGGIKDIYIRNCIFEETDRGVRLKTRRGRGGIVDGIYVKDIFMEKVKTPFVINEFYFCDIDGKEEYVWSKEPKEVTEETPEIRNVILENIECIDSEVSAGFVYGLPESKIENLKLKDFRVTFSENSEEDFPAMMSFIEKKKKSGFYFNNVRNLEIENVYAEDVTDQEIMKFNVE